MTFRKLIEEQEDKAIKFTDKGKYIEVKGFTVKRAKNSDFIKNIQDNPDNYSIFGNGKTLEIRQYEPKKNYFLEFSSNKALKVFNTEIFYKKGL